MVEFREYYRRSYCPGRGYDRSLKEKGLLGYAIPVVAGAEDKAGVGPAQSGLGIMGNMEATPNRYSAIEDTAVDIQDLPAYIRSSPS